MPSCETFLYSVLLNFQTASGEKQESVFGFKRPVKGETNSRFGNTAEDDEEEDKPKVAVNPNRQAIKPVDPEIGGNRKER